MSNTGLLEAPAAASLQTETMQALVFHGPNQLTVDAVPIPVPGYGEAVIRVTLTTICGTDVHIAKGEYPVAPGHILGHEAVGTIHQLGPGLRGYAIGQRVLVGAITPCGHCSFCLNGNSAQCGGVAMGGWKIGNTLDGAQAQFMLVPNAQTNMAKIPDRLTDEQVLLLADIASTGFSAVERAEMQLGDTVVIMGQGPIGLCATMGARIRGAGFIIAVDPHRSRRAMALRMGADVVLDPDQHDIPAEIQRLTAGRGVDLAIEAVGEAITFETALRCLRPGGTLSSLGVYSTDIRLPLDAFAAGLGDYKIVSTLCPGGKERMYRLMELVLHERMDLTALLTHSYRLDEIVHAYELFTSHKDGVLKIAIRP